MSHKGCDHFKWLDLEKMFCDDKGVKPGLIDKRGQKKGSQILWITKTFISIHAASASHIQNAQDDTN